MTAKTDELAEMAEARRNDLQAALVQVCLSLHSEPTPDDLARWAHALASGVELAQEVIDRHAGISRLGAA